MLFVDPLATLPVKDMNSLTRVKDNVFSILVQHSTIQVFVLSPLCTFECCDSILFVESDFLDSCKMAVFSLVDFNN